MRFSPPDVQKCSVKDSSSRNVQQPDEDAESRGQSDAATSERQQLKKDRRSSSICTHTHTQPQQRGPIRRLPHPRVSQTWVMSVPRSSLCISTYESFHQPAANQKPSLLTSGGLRVCVCVCVLNRKTDTHVVRRGRTRLCAAVKMRRKSLWCVCVCIH